MTDERPGEVRPEDDLACANCGTQLGSSDKYCRECGLPTLRQAQTQRAVPVLPPDAPELKHVLERAPDLQPFMRDMPEAGDPDLTTGSILRVTNPTFATQLAASTAFMVGVIGVLLAVGIGLLVIAFSQ